jgi:hypothetical protein
VDFKKGDKVTFLREAGHGIIQSITGTTALILDDYGFENEYELKLLVPVHKTRIKLELKKNMTEEDKPQKVIKGKKEKSLPTIDLHIESLLDSHKNMTNHEILTTQLIAFKKFLKFNEEKQLPKMIVIHGLGEGRLKGEIRILINAITGASMHDADYQKFGGGASVVERKYNWH